MPASPDGWIDISRALSPSIACWSGDIPYRFQLNWEIARGAAVNVGSMETSLHTATHCDAPYHFNPHGQTVDQLALDTFAGPARIVDLQHQDWEEAVAGLDLRPTPRLLFRTGAWPDSACFPERIPTMPASLPRRLAAQGVILVGVDVPSVDALDSKSLPIHHALGQAGIVIVEGLWLDDVTPGIYEFVGLPLKVVGGDGAPLRAAVRPFPLPDL